MSADFRNHALQPATSSAGGLDFSDTEAMLEFVKQQLGGELPADAAALLELYAGKCKTTGATVYRPYKLLHVLKSRMTDKVKRVEDIEFRDGSVELKALLEQQRAMDKALCLNVPTEKGRRKRSGITHISRKF